MKEQYFGHAVPGDKVKITGNTNDHPFEMGQEVLVTSWYDFEPADGEFGVEVSEHKETEHWFIRHADYVIVERGSHLILEDDTCG
ncbi:hypothetical protein [Paenibacillus terrigena]|uniref:hypothetical protein n=1 Tax=Paenibacillus terrigena TaxID=369333 RepID=UPI0028D1D2A5|nr:hypothetical protein [Paenibacillus terrigena]